VIDAVLLDVGGVLVMPAHALVGGIASGYGGRPGTDALHRGHYEGVAAGERPGGFDWADYRRALLGAAGVPDDRLDAAQAELGRAMKAPADTVWAELLPGATQGLTRLGATGVALAVVSNADGTVGALLRRLGLVQVGAGDGVAVTIVVDSGAVGVEKPDPRIFRLAIDALGTDPGRVVHVGDTINADVDGARNAGVRPLHLDPIGWCTDATHEHVGSLGAVADLVADGG
jgi:putative hydrolase of the HAD superfamily